jgi:hypothetical protein
MSEARYRKFISKFSRHANSRRRELHPTHNTSINSSWPKDVTFVGFIIMASLSGELFPKRHFGVENRDFQLRGVPLISQQESNIGLSQRLIAQSVHLSEAHKMQSKKFRVEGRLVVKFTKNLPNGKSQLNAMASWK